MDILLELKHITAQDKLLILLVLLKFLVFYF